MVEEAQDLFTGPGGGKSSTLLTGSELLFCVREPNYLLTPELSATRATGDVFSGMLAALSHGALHEDFLLCAVGSVERQGLGRSWLCYFLAGRFTSTCLRFFVHKVGSSYGE